MSSLANKPKPPMRRFLGELLVLLAGIIDKGRPILLVKDYDVPNTWAVYFLGLPHEVVSMEVSYEDDRAGA